MIKKGQNDFSKGSVGGCIIGVMGVFMAEPISNVIGGLASTVKIKFLIY